MDINDINRLRVAAQSKLSAQAARAAVFQSYFDNEAGVLAILDTEERRVFRNLLAESQANWCELVVQAVAERLQVVGFGFGSEEASAAAWEIWQANSMDADGELVQLDALTMSSSFALVQPDDDNPTGVCITAESPMQATVLYEPGNRRKRVAGYKRFGLDYDAMITGTTLQTGAVVEVLITPDQIFTWWPSGSPDNPQIDPNPAGFVGLVEIIPQPRTLKWPRSELHSAMTIQDRINTTLFNRLVAVDFAAFRQVWATGVKVAANVAMAGTSGQPTVVRPPFNVGANRLLASENPDSRFGAIPESTLAGYLAAVAQDVEHLAAITQTPPTYLLGQMVNLSADAIKASEAGLVAKCGRRARHIGEGWEEVMRLALQLTGNPAATYVAAEVKWADMETRSEGQRVDALTKMATLGVPRRVLWQKWGASPQEITDWEAMIAADPSEVVTPPTPPPSPAPTPEPVPTS